MKEKEIVNQFAEEMFKKIVKRRKKYKPLGWRDPKYKSIKDLEIHLESEIEEYKIATNFKDSQEELIDIAVCCLMLWDRGGFER